MTYRIHGAAQRSGVSEANPRAWERRYGVPKPARSPGGYRLYSDTDIERVKAMRSLMEQGIAPAEAAQSVLPRDTPPLVVPTTVSPVRAALMKRISDAAPGLSDAHLEAVARLAESLSNTAVATVEA